MQTLGPTLDDLIETKGGCLTTTVAAVKDLSVDEGALIVAFHLVGSGWLAAVALAEHLVLQTARKGHHTGLLRILGKEVLTLCLGCLGLLLSLLLEEGLHGNLGL